MGMEAGEAAEGSQSFRMQLKKRKEPRLIAGFQQPSEESCFSVGGGRFGRSKCMDLRGEIKPF